MLNKMFLKNCHPVSHPRLGKHNVGRPQARWSDDVHKSWMQEFLDDNQNFILVDVFSSELLNEDGDSNALNKAKAGLKN